MAEGVNIPISLDVTDVDISNLDTSQITHMSKIVAKDLGELAKVINQIFKSADLSKFGNTMTTALGNIEKKANGAATANQALVKTLASIGASTAQYQNAVANVEKLEAALREAQHFQKSTEELVMDAQATGQPISKELYDSYVKINQEVSRLSVELEKAKAAVGNPADWAGLVENLSEEQVDKFVASLSKLVSAVHDAQLATTKYNQTVEESKFTDEYQDKITAIEKLKQKMEDLNQKTKDMQELGATDKQWAKAELEAKKLSTEMGSLITQARELVKTGAAFRFGDADGTGAKEQKAILRSMSGSRSTLLRNITDRSMENRTPFTEEYEKALKVIEQLEKELDKLEEKARRLTYTGGTENQWRGMQFDVDNLKAKIVAAADEAKRLVESGQAFRFGNGDAEAEMGRIDSTASSLADRLDSIQTKGPISGKEIAKAFQQANATLTRLLNTVTKLVKEFVNLGHSSKKSSNDMSKSLKKLWKNFLMFGLGFRSMYFFIKKLRTTFINEFKLMAQVIPEVNEQISSFMTHVNQLKGSLGTAFQPLMTVVIPALNAFIDALVAAMNAVGRFFATLTGQGYIYKYTAYEVDYAKSLEDTAGAADKARRSLMGFDEINRLDADKQGGGAGAGDKQEGFWEKAPTEDAYSKLADLMKKGWAKSDWTEVGEYLGEGLKESLDHAVEKLNGDAKDFGQRVALVLATGINGFIDTPGLSTSLGETIAAVINTGFSIANTFLDTTNFVGLGQFLQNVVETAINEVQWNQVGAYFGNKLRAMVDFAWGFIHDFDFAAAGQAIADAINGFFEEMGNVNPESGLTGWQELGESISDTIKGITTTISTALKEIEWGEVGTAIGEMISSIDWSGIVWNFAGLAWSIVCGIGQALADWHDTSPISASIAELIGVAILGVKIVPAILKVIPLFKGLGKVFSLVASGATSLHDAFTLVFGGLATTVTGIVSFIGGIVLAITNFFSMLKNGFSWVKEILMVIGTALAAIGAVILGICTGPIAALVAAIVAAVMTIVVLVKDNWEAVKAVLVQIGETILYFCEMLGVIVENLFALVVGIIGGAIGAIVGIFEGLWVSLQEIWGGIKEVFQGIIDFIGGIFTGDWERAWEGIKEIFKGIWDTFVGIVKAPINLIIGLINGMISGFCTGLNFIIKGLNKLSFKVPDWIPGIGGQEWGFDIKELSPAQIPYLAQGAVIPPNKQFLAMLGDQKSGTNVEAPLATIEQAVANVMGDQLEALAAIGEAVIAAINEKDLNVVIGDREIGRAANRYNNRQNLVKGV